MPNNFKAPGTFQIVSLTNESTLGVSRGISFVCVNGSDTTVWQSLVSIQNAMLTSSTAVGSQE